MHVYCIGSERFTEREYDRESENVRERVEGVKNIIRAVPVGTNLNPSEHGWFLDRFFKVLREGVKLNFLIFFLHRGIRNKKVCKV